MERLGNRGIGNGVGDGCGCQPGNGNDVAGARFFNRNPLQTNRAYVPGRVGWVPEPAVPEMDDPRVELRRKRFEEATRRVAG